MQVNKNVYACFEKLLNIMERVGIPQLERNLIKSLYWNQYAIVKTTDGKSRRCLLIYYR